MHPTLEGLQRIHTKGSTAQVFPKAKSDLSQVPENERRVSHRLIWQGSASSSLSQSHCFWSQFFEVLTYFLPFRGKTETNKCLARTLVLRNGDSVFWALILSLLRYHSALPTSSMTETLSVACCPHFTTVFSEAKVAHIFSRDGDRACPFLPFFFLL